MKAEVLKLVDKGNTLEDSEHNSRNGHSEVCPIQFNVGYAEGNIRL